MCCNDQVGHTSYYWHGSLRSGLGVRRSSGLGSSFNLFCNPLRPTNPPLVLPSRVLLVPRSAKCVVLQDS
ncbi:hypothetical protein PspLS_03818 [Pyricularia sp. CBS 133598]|nr:hypothetical protein PspLS_03818 [Pyricularia sp. CBS 133598]